MTRFLKNALLGRGRKPPPASRLRQFWTRQRPAVGHALRGEASTDQDIQKWSEVFSIVQLARKWRNEPTAIKWAGRSVAGMTCNAAIKSGSHQRSERLEIYRIPRAAVLSLVLGRLKDLRDIFER